MEMKFTEENAFFVASNSSNGFYSHYSACFDDKNIKRVYAIKGGPGTGKNRFLREVSVCGVLCGYSCEYIYCSSDPESLDGVILEKSGERIALLDATFPHVYDPKNPGVREELIDLCAFWNRKKLAEYGEEISRINRQKNEAYERVYRYLAGAGKMDANRRALIKPYIRTDAIRSFAAKLLRDVDSDGVLDVRPALIRSLGMRGDVCLDTYFRQAKQLFVIEDCRGSAQYLTEALLSLAIEKKLRLRFSHDPVLTECCDGIFLETSGIVFAVIDSRLCRYPHKLIRMRRFVDIASMQAIRGEINFSERMYRSMLAGAAECLTAIKALHFRLEEIYGTAMDFEKKEIFTKIFCQRLFDLQNDASCDTI